MSRAAILVLLALNLVVLLGQVWPEGAPPFARIVNILVVVANVLALGLLFLRGHGGRAP